MPFLPVSIRRADFWRLELLTPQMRSRSTASFNPPGGFLASGTTGVSVSCRKTSLFQSAGRIFGVWNGICAFSLKSRRYEVSIRRADFWRLELPLCLLPDCHLDVSIRRADFWRLEHFQTAHNSIKVICFNPPGGFLASGTTIIADRPLVIRDLFQSAGRIFGVWNRWTGLQRDIAPKFQSAGRIFGVWNATDGS